MANVLVEEQYLSDIADAIRSKNGSATTYKPYEMDEAILALSGGGLSYETGTWTPSEDVARGSITFGGTHTKAPFFVGLVDSGSSADTTTNTNWSWNFFDFYQLDASSVYYSSSARRYGSVHYTYRASSTTSLSNATLLLTYSSNNTGSSSTAYAKYWVTNTGFRPYSNSTSRYWRSGRTYRWIAIWLE